MLFKKSNIFRPKRPNQTFYTPDYSNESISMRVFRVDFESATQTIFWCSQKFGVDGFSAHKSEFDCATRYILRKVPSFQPENISLILLHLNIILGPANVARYE